MQIKDHSEVIVSKVIFTHEELLNIAPQGVLILAGLPGSGKSKLAKDHEAFRLVTPCQYSPIKIMSSDHHFMRSGEYKFDPSELGEAHDRCWKRFVGCCDAWHKTMGSTTSRPLIIVDNTNTSPFELAPYVRYATGLGVPVLTLFVKRNFELCVRDQAHGVSLETMQRMSRNLVNTHHEFPMYWESAIWRS